jgi:hypothetical protein
MPVPIIMSVWKERWPTRMAIEVGGCERVRMWDRASELIRGLSV